jgi:hypothetical protein
MRCRPGKLKSLRTEWYRRAAELPAEWDEGLPPDSFLLRRSLQLQEEASLPDLEPGYALLRSEQGILGKAAFQILSLRPEHVKADSLPAWQYSLLRTAFRLLLPKLLAGGQLFRHDVLSTWHSPDLSPFDAFDWYRNALAALRRKTHAAAVLLKELPDELVPYFQHRAPEYLLLRNDISMQLAIPASWSSIADYQASLKHKYAQRFRKVRQAWARLHVRELSAEESLLHAGTLYALYRQVAEHQPVRLGFLSKDFLPGLKRAYGEELRLWGIWEDDRMVAFASGWVHEQSFDMFYIGLDYARNAELQLYFNILFFAVEQAIALHKPLLILGRTALEAKARAGCRPRYLNTFLHIRNPLLRALAVRLQSKLSDGGGEWEQRHPFASPQD